MLRQSRLDNSRDVLMTQLCTVHLLIIDDFALEPMTRDESRDVHQLFVERTARAATLVTSNGDTSEWLATFDDVLLAQSAVDRFKNAAFDLVVEGASCRPRQKPSVRDGAPPPSAPVSKPDRPIKRRKTLTETQQPGAGLRRSDERLREDDRRDANCRSSTLRSADLPGPMMLKSGGPFGVQTGIQSSISPSLSKRT